MNTVVSKRIRVKDIAEHIRAEISQKRLKAGTAVLSARAFASKFKVSVLTANRALNKLVDEGILYRIQGSGTFVKGSQFGGSMVIGIADMSDTQNDPGKYAANGIFLDSCLTQLSKYDCKVKYLSYKDFCEFEKMSSLLNSIDGLVISASYLDARTKKIFERYKGILTFYRNEYIIDIPCNQVIPDLDIGIKEVFNKISPNNYQGIIIISAEHSNAHARCSHFLKQSLKAGFKEETIIEKHISLSAETNVRLKSYQFALEMIDQFSNKLVFCTSDFISLGLLDAARESGIMPGVDFDLVSYDNLEAYGMHPFTEPFLTTIDFPRKEVAKKAVELTVAAVKKRDRCQHIIKVPTHLIIRETGLKNKIKETKNGSQKK
jgi:GntR family transcriptional regulator, arabinose operon transcriptional repressor